MLIIKIIIILSLIAIIGSLGLALLGMFQDKGRSDRVLRALTLRVILSIALFVFLLIAFATGLITPHGI